MASTEIINLTDDLDNSITEGVHTVNFFDPETGDKVELELGEKNIKALNKAIAGLEKYLAVARVVLPPKPAAKVSGPKSDLTKVREWATAHGYKVGDRGRIKAEILEAYDKAHMPTAIEGGKVELTVSPEAQASLDKIAESMQTAVVEVTGLDSEGVDKIEQIEIPCPEGKEGCEVMHTVEVDSVDDSGNMTGEELAEFLVENTNAEGTENKVATQV